MESTDIKMFLYTLHIPRISQTEDTDDVAERRQSGICHHSKQNMHNAPPLRRVGSGNRLRGHTEANQMEVADQYVCQPRRDGS